jgi:hypothetical protein
LACIKEHNAKYVFVRNGKVYNIDHQDFAALQEHAGHTVKLSGEMKGDTITVSKIVMPPRKRARDPCSAEWCLTRRRPLVADIAAPWTCPDF